MVAQTGERKIGLWIPRSDRVTEKLGAIVYKGERAAMIDLFDFDQVICLKR